LTHVQGGKRDRRDVIGEAEFRLMLEASKIGQLHPYYALRNPAVLCLLYLTGKRAGEVATVKLGDVVEAGDFLEVTFTVLKKRNRSPIWLQRTKALPLGDPYTRIVLDYLGYMEASHPDCLYLFPSTRYTHLNRGVVLDPLRPLSRTTVWRVVTRAGEDAWPHLFRETMGARVARSYGDTLTALFAVKRRLDLEKMDTAMRYVERYAVERIESATTKKL